MTAHEAGARWHGELGGRLVEVELTIAGVGTDVRLFCDGLETDRAHTRAEPWTRLEGPGFGVVVRWGLLGRPAWITATAGDPAASIDLSPPAGGRRARFEAWLGRHPRARRLAHARRRLAQAAGPPRSSSGGNSSAGSNPSTRP